MPWDKAGAVKRCENVHGTIKGPLTFVWREGNLLRGNILLPITSTVCALNLRAS